MEINTVKSVHFVSKKKLTDKITKCSYNVEIMAVRDSDLFPTSDRAVIVLFYFGKIREQL